MHFVITFISFVVFALRKSVNPGFRFRSSTVSRVFCKLPSLQKSELLKFSQIYMVDIQTVAVAFVSKLGGVLKKTVED